MILVVCAVERELRFWKPRANVEILATGIGPVEAAAATSRALAAAPPRLVVNAGIAGGFRGRAEVGEAIAIQTEHLAELGLEDGSPIPGGLELVAQTSSDPGLIELCARARVRIGTGVTVATITTSTHRAETLASRFAADAEAMEGFAVLRAAALAGIPAIELRGISNVVGPRAESGWDFEAGARAAGAALDRFFDAIATLDTTGEKTI